MIAPGMDVAYAGPTALRNQPLLLATPAPDSLFLYNATNLVESTV